MPNLFLKAKHWQLFIVLFALPVILHIVIMGIMLSNIVITKTPEPTFMFSYFNFFIVIMIIYLFGLMGWFWSIAIGLQEKLPPHFKMKVKQFKFFFFVPLFYISSVLIGVSFSISNSESFTDAITPNVLGIIVAIIFPLHLFSMFCMFYIMFYIMFFAAKTLKSAELSKEAEFGEYIVELLLLWFYPVGIWIIQPKINKLASIKKHYN